MRANFSITPGWLRQARELEPPAPPLDLLLRSGAKHEKKAFIATTLNELATPHVQAGTRIMVVGNDLPSVADAGYVWAHDQNATAERAAQEAILGGWLRKGATLRYFAIAPSPAAVARLREVAEKFPGQLELRRLSANAANDSRATRMAQLWRQSHFAVFENKPQLWVECYHPPEKLEAKDCFYFAPELAAASPLYPQYREEFEWMFSQFGDPVI